MKETQRPSKKVRMTFSRNNGARYYVTGFQKAASVRTCAYVYRDTRTHAQTQWKHRDSSTPPPLHHHHPQFSYSVSVKSHQQY